MSDSRLFTYRCARSGALLAAILSVILIESLVLHLWLVQRHPVVAWSLSASSVSLLVWLVGDFRALGRGAVDLAAGTLHLNVGWRAAAVIPLSSVATIIRPSWRELPTPGSNELDGYLNLMKPAQPNALLTLKSAATVRLMGGLRRPVRRIGLLLDEPERFIASVTSLLEPSRASDRGA